MYRNLILAALTLLTIFIIGCSDTVILSSDEVSQALQYHKIDIFINESDGTLGHYQAANTACSVINDTLFGRAGKVSENGQLSAAYLKVPLSKIKYFEVEEFNAGKTILLTGGIIGTAALIAVLTSNGKEKSPPPPPQSTGSTMISCPLIYTLGNSGYKLESETFAGAVFKGVERTSYDVLNNLQPINGTYKIKLVNARQETEYVNELKLIAADHSPNVSVIPDVAGNIHTLSKLNKALSVFDKHGNDVTEILSEKDGHYWESNLKSVDVNKNKDLIDNVTAKFLKPKYAKTVKIIVSGLNTKLAYFALEKIFAFQGNKRIDWYNQLDSNPVERSKFFGWLMREGMLHFEVWTGKTWDERGFMPDVGPGVEKTQITIMNIADIPGDTLKVRVSFRTGLWRLDRIAADYSADQPVETNEISAVYATNEKGENVSDLIARPDSAYYVTIYGEYANVCFAVPQERPGLSRTLIAKTRGFYNQWALQGEKQHPEEINKILNVPLYSSKLLIPLWLKENSKQDLTSAVN